MESNLVSRRRRLKGQIPDIKSSLIMIDHLREKSAVKEEIESHFLISDQAYSKAAIPPTDKVITKILECTPSLARVLPPLSVKLNEYLT